MSMSLSTGIEWKDLPFPVKNHIEWCEGWQDEPPFHKPTEKDLALAEALLEAWCEGYSLDYIVAIYQKATV